MLVMHCWMPPPSSRIYVRSQGFAPAGPFAVVKVPQFPSGHHFFETGGVGPRRLEILGQGGSKERRILGSQLGNDGVVAQLSNPTTDKADGGIHRVSKRLAGV